MIKYVFREDAVLGFKGAKKANAQKLGEAYEAAGRDDEAVFEAAAKNRRHAFYPHLEWDKDVAWREYNVSLVGKIMRTITIVNLETGEPEPRGHISLISGGKRERFTPQEIRTSADLQASMLRAARRDLEHWQTRYRALSDLCEDAQSILNKIDDRLAKTESRAAA